MLQVLLVRMLQDHELLVRMLQGHSELHVRCTAVLHRHSLVNAMLLDTFEFLIVLIVTSTISVCFIF